MASLLDKSLDEITAERRNTQPNRPRRGGPRVGGGRGGGPIRQDIRRSQGGVTKRRVDSYSSSGRPSRGNANDTWTHDLFERNGDARDRLAGNPLAARLGETQPGRLKVENLHYELTEDDLNGLFSKIGPVQSLRLKYDKMGRSDGVAFVTYASIADANEAVQKFNGANAAGQPITVTLDTEGPPRRESRPRPDRGFARGGPRFGGRMGGGGRGGPRSGPSERRERRGPRTQEDLDKELDEFMSGPPPAAENGNGAETTEAGGDEMAVD